MLMTAVLLLVHVPPPVASLKASVRPSQTEEKPVMAAGARLTVSVVVVLQLPMV